jgi:protein tyrosine phosphatase (PTP) superfamily phosphohydrolase (DUF442 family)
LLCSEAFAQNSSDAAIEPSSSESLPTKLKSKYLPNLVQVHREVYSGGLPEGADAFEELRTMGIRTIISVDGVTPDVHNADSHQMQYVHLPHGYDGIPEARVLELAKAIRELPKPIYIHCHHGRHRSPTAASVACLAAGLITPTDARAVLEIAGTGKNYRGLFASVESVRFDPSRNWMQLQVDFQPIAPIPPIARSMVSIDHFFSRIQSAQSAAQSDETTSKSTRRSMGIDMAHDLLMLKELYVELIREPNATNDPSFSKYLTDGIAIIDSMSASDNESMKMLIQPLEQNCKSCHQIYRDLPQLNAR